MSEATAPARCPQRTPRPKLRSYASHAPDAVLWARTSNTYWPWKRWEYPGWIKAAAAALDYAPATVARWLSPGSSGVSSEAARTIAAYIAARIQAEQQLLAEWHAYASEREALESSNHRYFFREAKAAERDGWRSAPRRRG